MTDLSDHDEILKEYDPDLMKRLLKFLKPYLAVFLLSIGVLLLATAGELYTPFLLRKAVDGYILPFYRLIRIDFASPEIISRLDPVDPDYVIGGNYYFPSSRLSDLNARQKKDLRDRGILSSENYIVIKDHSRKTELRNLLRQYPDLFHLNQQIAVAREIDIRSMDRNAIKLIRKDNYQGLSSVALRFLLVLIGVLIFTFSQVYLQAYVGQMIMKDLRTELFDHTLGLSLRFIDANPVGRLVTRVTNDVETINELFTTVLSSLLRDFSMMFGVLAALFLLSPRLALITLLSLPPVMILTFFFRYKARDAFRRVRRAVSRLNSFLSEHISGMRIVQFFAREEQSKEEFDQRNSRLLKANLGEMYVFATFRPIVDLLSSVSIAVIIYAGAHFLLRDLVSLGVLIAFINLIGKFYEPVRDLSEKYNILQSAMAGAERVFELLDEKSKISQPSAPVPLEKVRGSIVFDDVTFRYKEGETVLKNLSFQARPGETVAIVGYTGAGKTTITSLLTRLWDIQEGAIMLDGVDIKNIPTSQLRRKVQSVLQDVFLFSGTIEHNIRLGSDIPAERIREAIRMVRADTFIDRLPEGLNTVLNERGTNLSMGQRQLLSFARVLAHNPDVLVLDEATGNIDTETEKLIQEALKKLLDGRTSLVIAHRLSTIRSADRILVLHKGEVIESGTHKELIKKQGMYYNLYQMQFLNTDRSREGEDLTYNKVEE